MIELIFLASVFLLWSFVLWHLFLAVQGARFAIGRARARPRLVADDRLPGVSVMIPARNEARVIERSLQRLLASDYPADKIEVVVIDDASTDGTGAICDRIATTDPRVKVVHVPQDEGGRGKAAALNRALPFCSHPAIAVYDADNRPAPDALRRLVGALVQAPAGRYAAAVGHIAKMNRHATILNRFSSFEFAAFQWGMQASRALLFDLVLITGTNFVVASEAVRKLGGWDEAALTEDLELSLRLFGAGFGVLFVPEARSEEQDPQRLRPWIRQRVRWTLGNLHALRRHLRWLFLPPNRRTWNAMVSLVAGYTAFLGALLASDAIFIAGALGVVQVDLPGPYLALWVAAILGFVATLLVTASLEGEPAGKTALIAGLMYVSYTQLWLYVIGKSLLRVLTGRNRFVWVPTPRSHD